MSGEIRSTEALAALYPPARGRSVLKELAVLDPHCRRFIALSPFVVVATASAAGRLDSSPRGGEPGFVKVAADGALLIPDSPGNNRLDSLRNILETREIGLLFMIPGVDETLRVNGPATISAAPGDLAACTSERRAPKAAIRVAVREAYLHCAKAFMRSRLWDASRHVERAVLPTMSQMINDQTGGTSPMESQEAMRRRYEADL